MVPVLSPCFAPTRAGLGLLLVLGLSACQITPEPAARGSGAAAGPLSAAASGGCWATDLVPAQTETRFLVNADGSRHPVEVPVRPAEERLFAVPCAEAMTPDLVASLQRALLARGLYAGAVSGQMDDETRAAVRRYQAPLGLDSATLSLDAARGLGLIAVGRQGG